MKKLLLLLVVAIVAFAASADTYVKVKGDFNGWTDGGVQPVNNIATQKGLAIGTGGFKIEVWDGTKDTWYSTGSALSQKQWIQINGNADGNMTISGATADQKFDIQFDVSTNKIYVTPVSNTYTIYFYDKDANASHNDVKVHIWGDGDLHQWNTDNEKMTSTGKYFKDNSGNYHPVWSYTFTSTKNFTNLKFHNNGSDLTDDLNNLVNDGVYNNDGKTTLFTKNDLCDKQDIPAEKTYTVYFYNAGNANISAVNAFVWEKDGVNIKAWPGEAMTRVANKYVYYNGKYCPVWSYTFKTDITPKQIIFNGTGITGSKEGQTADLSFLNEAFYRQDGHQEIGMTLVNKPEDEVVTIYMHWKEDYVKGAADNTKPRCHVFKQGTSVQFAQYGTAAEDMYLVSKKYQIWGFDVPKKDISKYDNITFYYSKKDGGGEEGYTAKNGPKFEEANWTKYIYATHEGYAIQTYLSYDEFQALDAKGRPVMYIVGGGMDDQDAAISIDNDGKVSNLGWDTANATEVTPDDGCFYLKLTPDFKSQDQVGFKFGWISVKKAKSKITTAYQDGERDWATFDLGIVGVDDITIEKNWNNILSIETNHTPGWSIFDMNKSMPYLNYNQFNWVIKKNKVTANKAYYVVVDTHNECRTVTLASFDPHPTVSGSVAGIEKETITDIEVAKAMHNSHLHASELNGHVIMTELNKAKGSATIKKAEGSVVGQAGFSVEYTLNLNGNTVVASNPGTIDFDYMPVAASSRQMSVRAKYTDSKTKLTFHSRTGEGEISIPRESLNAPNNLSLEGKYVFQGYTDDKRQIYGVYVEGLDCEFTSGLNAYSDFRFNEGNARFVHDGLDWYNDRAKDIDWVHAWKNWSSDENDPWSKPLMAKRAVDDPAPLFIHDVVVVDSFDDLKSLPEKTITGEVYAVYPFLYNPKATLEVRSSGAPRRANAEAATNYDGFIVTNTHVANTIEVHVTSDGAVSGIADVEGDATAEDAPVEYYTVSGIRVAGDPAPGIYVRRQGDKVCKVVIR